MFYGCRTFLFFLFQCDISELHQPICVKLCTMISSRPSFMMSVQNLRGHPPKNFEKLKHAKFGSISDEFIV